jgi:hypothetical protein
MQNFDWETSWEMAILKTEGRWEDNIKLVLREMDYEDGRWMELAQDYVHWWALILVVLECLGSTTRESCSLSKFYNFAGIFLPPFFFFANRGLINIFLIVFFIILWSHSLY